jgi:hypothetical protein
MSVINYSVLLDERASDLISTEQCAVIAACSGNIELLRQLVDQDSSRWGSRLCAAAASGDQLDTLRWLRNTSDQNPLYPPHSRERCEWDKMATREAARVGNLATLQWLRSTAIHGSNIAPWSVFACACASRNGHLELLQWMRRPDIPGGPCPWNFVTWLAAVKQGNPQLKDWCRKNDCPRH